MERGNIVCSYKKAIINGEHLIGTKPVANERSPAQLIGFLRYINPKKTKEGQLHFKLDRIMMGHGGIPNLHKDFYPTDKKRAKSFKIPLYNVTEKEKAMYSFIESLDIYFDSTDFKRNVMKFSEKKMNDYKYSPIMRHPRALEEDDEDDDDEILKKKKMAREKVAKYGAEPCCIKPQIDLDYDTDVVKSAVIYNKGDYNTIDEDEANKVSVEKENIAMGTLDDMQKYLNFRSKDVFVLTPMKIWLKKDPEPKQTYREWGVSLKLVAADCVPATGATTVSTNDNPLQSDDEDEDDEIQIKPSKISNKKIIKEEEEEEEENDDDVDEDEESADLIVEEEEEEVVMPPKAPNAKKSKVPEVEKEAEEEVEDIEEDEAEEDEAEEDEAEEDEAEEDEENVEEEEEEEEEEVVAPVKTKKTAKKSKIPEPEPEEEDEEEEEVVAPVKTKKTAKKSKIPEPEPEEEDDEEVVVPVKPKKTTKKTK
jgi:hypothetical protein